MDVLIVKLWADFTITVWPMLVLMLFSLLFIPLLSEVNQKNLELDLNC